MPLIQPIKIETDSFYKFLVTFGLVIVLFSASILEFEKSKTSSFIEKVEIEKATLKADFYSAKKISEISANSKKNDLEELEYIYKISGNFSKEKLTNDQKDKIQFIFKDMQHNYSLDNYALEMIDKNLPKTVTVNADEAILNVKKKLSDEASKWYYILLAFGAILMLSGLTLWYFRLQLPLDRLLKNKVKHSSTNTLPPEEA